LTAARVRDFVVYIAIALTIGVLAFLFAEENLDAKWRLLVFETALVFGCAVGWNRPLWPLPVFWASILLMLVGHLVVFVILLRVEEWRSWDVAQVWVVETLLVQALIIVSRRTFARHRPSSDATLDSGATSSEKSTDPNYPADP
jgi:hypothetical protein